MRSFIFTLLLLTIYFNTLDAQEHRSTWVTNIASNALFTRDNIANTLDSLAANNFNSASVVVWNGGFPLFPSQTYYDVTGRWIHPDFANRDPLKEFIEEAHLRGITVYAWFEYGFAARFGQPGPILDARPDWAAQTVNGNPYQGTETNPSYYWLSHGNKEVWDFLIGIQMEIVLNYDIDGIEFDRLRYGNVMFGYDSATVAWYKEEHNNQPPPANFSDTAWRAWRSGILDRFMMALYDSVKSENPNIAVSNAPIVYPFGYENFLQDWRKWVQQGSVDFIVPQMYRDNFNSYLLELTRGIDQVGDKTDKLVPGIRVRGGPGDYTPLDQLLMMVDETQKRNLPGMYFWFYEGLPGRTFEPLRENYFTEAAYSPFHPEDWRKYRAFERPLGDYVVFEGDWSEHIVPGFRGQTYRSERGQQASVTYYFDVPASGWYSVLYHRRATSDGAREGRMRVFGSNGDTVTVTVNLRDLSLTRGWTKIAPVYLEQKDSAQVMMLDAPDIQSDERLITDAVAIILDRQRSPDAVTSVEPDRTEHQMPADIHLYQNYPNPFNPGTTIRFSLNTSGSTRLALYDVLGREIDELVNEYKQKGSHEMYLDGSNLTSGTYYLVLIQNGLRMSKKIILLK